VSISFEYKKRPVNYHFNERDLKLTEDFSKKLKDELGELLKAVVLFGSAARGTQKGESDIDVLLVLNDLTVVLSQEVISSLRVIIENVASSISNKFHITSMHLSEFWEYARQGDPIIVNILREGRSVYDEGFFLPFQTLLDQGKIRPTKEAVWAYYLRAPKTIKNAQGHILQATVDLYWAVIDAAHAALMHVDVTPGAPHTVGDLLEEHLVSKGLLDKKYVRILRKFYMLAKDIGHNHLTKISGKDVDGYILEASDFVKRMKFIISQDSKKLIALKK
jgi:predicted nucleotidyltransferase/uncharacterized protein (UPF0332 family)